MSGRRDWKKFELNNKSIAVDILFVPYNTGKIRLTYKSKHSFKRENQVTLLMITDGKKWHYLAVKSLPALLREITSNHDGDFYCLNCFHSYSAEKNLKNVKEYAMIMIFVMQKCLMKTNIKIQPRRKVTKSSVYDLCRLGVSA